MLHLGNLLQASKLINRPSFERAEVFSENFCAIHLQKESIEMDKPIYIGTSILDLSKSLMYDYYYNNLKLKYKSEDDNGSRAVFDDVDFFRSQGWDNVIIFWPSYKNDQHDVVRVTGY